MDGHMIVLDPAVRVALLVLLDSPGTDPFIMVEALNRKMAGPSLPCIDPLSWSARSPGTSRCLTGRRGRVV